MLGHATFSYLISILASCSSSFHALLNSTVFLLFLRRHSLYLITAFIKMISTFSTIKPFYTIKLLLLGKTVISNLNPIYCFPNFHNFSAMLLSMYNKRVSKSLSSGLPKVPHLYILYLLGNFSSIVLPLSLIWVW